MKWSASGGRKLRRVRLYDRLSFGFPMRRLLLAEFDGNLHGLLSVQMTIFLQKLWPNRN
jgi:hypothetical protein